jgi:RHH-type rel operon transcriptional repressor/antitoxin RelB
MARMLAIRLPEDVEKRLGRLAKQTGRSKTVYAREAIEEHLADLEDYYLAVARKDDRRLSLEDMERRPGVAD